ncbi:DNA helicase [Tanacetum coccineum]
MPQLDSARIVNTPTAEYIQDTDEELAKKFDQERKAADDIVWSKIVEHAQERQSGSMIRYHSFKKKPVTVAQARKNMMVYLKNMANYKMKYFKGMSSDQMRPIFGEEYRKVQTLFKKDSKVSKSEKKRVAEEALLQESFKKFKGHTWMAFGGNTRDLGSFGKETDKTTTLHQILEEVVHTECGDGDEASMSDRRCFEALDRTLRDLMNTPKVLFGGKIVILGGDQSQCWSLLPSPSPTYGEISEFALLGPCMSEAEQEKSQLFAKWLLSVGDGELGEPDEQDDGDTSWVTIPSEYRVTADETRMLELIDFIYDQETLKTPTTGTLQEKAIVCPKNDTADITNAKKFVSNRRSKKNISEQR